MIWYSWLWLIVCIRKIDYLIIGINKYPNYSFVGSRHNSLAMGSVSIAFALKQQDYQYQFTRLEHLLYSLSLSLSLSHTSYLALANDKHALLCCSLHRVIYRACMHISKWLSVRISGLLLRHIYHFVVRLAYARRSLTQLDSTRFRRNFLRPTSALGIDTCHAHRNCYTAVCGFIRYRSRQGRILTLVKMKTANQGRQHLYPYIYLHKASLERNKLSKK